MDILKKEGFAGVRDLGERLYASQPTIRRDLDFLEKEGLVRRSHGGAVPADDRVNTPISYRKGRRMHEKMQIAALAATLIENDQFIFIDGSTTALCLADFLAEHEGISVLTNGMPLCHALAKQSVRVFCTGGRLDGESMAFVGSMAQGSVESHYADLMFFSSSSLSEDGMISDYAEEENALRLAMHKNSRCTVFLCDSEKWQSRSAFCLLALQAVDYTVTDRPLSDTLCRLQGLELVRQSEGAYMYGHAMNTQKGEKTSEEPISE